MTLPTLLARHPATRRGLLLALALAASLGSTAVQAQTVRLATSMGDIVIELDAARAPKTVDNFLRYVKAGHYSGTVFHRVIPGFMIQAGGMTAGMVEKPTRAPIALESRNGLTNQRGTVAMARRGDPDSATAQFFINLADNARLDAVNAADGNGYAVFGRVVDGMDVAERIRDVPTAERGQHQNVPLQPVVIKSVTVKP